LESVNPGRHDNKPSLSFDGATLYFGAAQRLGNLGVGCPYSAPRDHVPQHLSQW
jgi:hypothetical protein